MLWFAEWLDGSRVSAAIRDSTWLFPAIETVHLMGLAVLGGTLLIVDLRLLGVGLTRQSTAELLAEIEAWTIGALVVMLVSGGLLFASEARDLYGSGPFRVKMVVFLLALVFTFTVRRRVVRRAELAERPWIARLAGAVSLSLWTGVGVAGRAIAYW